MAQDSISVAHTYIQNLRSRGHSFGGYPVYNVTKDDLSALMKLGDKYGIPFEWLVNLINFESGRTFNPAIRNSIGATGLIQFLPSTASGLNTSTDALSKMTFRQQLVYVDRYLYSILRKHLNAQGKVPKTFTQGDLFMAIFYPVAVGRPGFSFPENVRKANAGISTPYDYAKKALAVSVFPLSVFPYSLADVKRFAKKNIVPIIIFATVLIVLAILLIVYRKKVAEYLTKL